ncbi:MAG: hypothetical protein ACR2OZ_04355 [Verrucomicrobiales bacterium]
MAGRIVRSSNLPADGSEHHVQLKVGPITSTKSYMPQTRVAATEKAPVEPTSAPPVSREATPGTAISDKAPSGDFKAPVALALGEVVKGRLAKSDETKKYHYWLLDLPAGKYKFVLDVKRADERDSNVGGRLFMINPDGKEGKRIGAMSQIDHRHRSVFRIEMEQALQGVLRYENSFTISDYYLGVFRASDRLNGLFFVNPPPVAPIQLGRKVTTPLLDGENTQKRDAYYSLKLPAADYKVSVEFQRQDKRDSNVGGVVSALDQDGEERIDRVVSVSHIGPAHQGGRETVAGR